MQNNFVIESLTFRLKKANAKITFRVACFSDVHVGSVSHM